MEKTTDMFGKLIKLLKSFENFGVADRVLFCIWQGTDTPRHLMEKLGVTKGNLTNYCNSLQNQNYITKQKSTKNVYYKITDTGINYIKGKLKNVSL